MCEKSYHNKRYYTDQAMLEACNVSDMFLGILTEQSYHPHKNIVINSW